MARIKVAQWFSVRLEIKGSLVAVSYSNGEQSERFWRRCRLKKRRTMDSSPSAFGSGELKCKMLNTESVL